MMDFLFFIKTCALTLLLVVIMQVRVGDQSLEQTAQSWVRSSWIAGPVNLAAQGGAKLVRDGSARVMRAVQGRPQGAGAGAAEREREGDGDRTDAHAGHGRSQNETKSNSDGQENAGKKKPRSFRWTPFGDGDAT